MSVSGDLPQDIIDSLQDKGVPYISRDTSNRGYADTPILRACAAYAAILGGKSARVARLSAMERRVFPMASHVGSIPSTTGNWVCMARVLQ